MNHSIPIGNKTRDFPRAIIYTTPTCKYCVEAKKFMAERGIGYTEIDVQKDPKARVEMIEKSKQMGVPVIVIGDQVIVGLTGLQKKYG